MSTYAIGDIQGCLDPLKKLLDKIKFDPQNDCLWFTGDLVNRGPDSVKALKFVKSLGPKARTVLGNHDLSLLALSVGAITPSKKDTFMSVIEYEYGKELIEWLKKQPLIIKSDELGFVMSHAGIYPGWSIDQAMALAQEVERTLISHEFEAFMHNMFGESPNKWAPDLQGWDRLRFITNALTRMRYCDEKGVLDLHSKTSPEQYKGPSRPWFEYSNPQWKDTNLIFGHWAALEGKCDNPNIFALDTGCVWGKCLTALCLETKQRFHIDCYE